MKEIISKLEKMDEKLDILNVEQVKIKKDLKYHIKRTDLLEAQVAPVSKAYSIGKVCIAALVTILLTFKNELVKLVSGE